MFFQRLLHVSHIDSPNASNIPKYLYVSVAERYLKFMEFERFSQIPWSDGGLSLYMHGRTFVHRKFDSDGATESCTNFHNKSFFVKFVSVPYFYPLLFSIDWRKQQNQIYISLVSHLSVQLWVDTIQVGRKGYVIFILQRQVQRRCVRWRCAACRRVARRGEGGR